MRRALHCVSVACANHRTSAVVAGSFGGAYDLDRRARVLRREERFSRGDLQTSQEILKRDGLVKEVERRQ